MRLGAELIGPGSALRHKFRSNAVGGLDVLATPGQLYSDSAVEAEIFTEIGYILTDRKQNRE